MAKIQETLVLQDQFSSSFGAYIQAAQRASSSTTAAQTAARNYQSVLNSVSRQLISANAKFESYVAQQEEMVAAGQQNTEAFKKLDTQTEKLGATIRGLEAQQQTLTQSMKAAESAASVAASAKDEAAAATKRLQEQENMAQSVTQSLTSSVLRLAASYLSIQGLKKAVDLSDSLVSMRARLDRMNDGLQTTQELETMIYQSAQRSRGSFTDTMGLVSQLGTMAGDAFSSSKEIVQFAEQLNKQLALSGASGSSAQAAILQLEQGLASGVLRGDELNSVMEQAPALAKSIADYMQVSVGELREMGSQGQITADIVKNALFAAAKDTNAEFEKTPMTWAQVWTVASNTAVRALDPLLTAINWVANNLDVAIPLVVSLGAAFGVLLIAANWTNILATATKTAASMQAFYNAVMAANPIALTAAAVLVLVAALYGGMAAFNKLTGSSISATGIITGAFTTMGAFILNGTLVPLHNGFAAFVNFLGNAFNDPITAIDVLFYDMSITILKYVQNVAQGLEGLINMIPGVEVNMTSGIDKLIGKLEYGRNWTIKQNGYKEYIKPWENFDLGKAYNAGHDWGANLNLSTVMGGGSGSLEIPQAADVKDLLGNIDKNTGKIAKTVDLSDEQIKMLVDVAERKYVNNVNLTSQTPMITVQGQNTGNTEKDARNLADTLRDVLVDLMNAGSTVTVQ
ncbi:tape measure protein [Faecalibacterium prausnitzii]|uniref:tape measure protein n=1 Tax=Faecalibacterium prausnitzii TaxID=853 RepID=UPI0012DBDA0E|nr:tape measure protein [Faecalibacterium prausnitzii]